MAVWSSTPSFARSGISGNRTVLVVTPGPTAAHRPAAVNAMDAEARAVPEVLPTRRVVQVGEPRLLIGVGAQGLLGRQDSSLSAPADGPSAASTFSAALSAGVNPNRPPNRARSSLQRAMILNSGFGITPPAEPCAVRP